MKTRSLIVLAILQVNLLYSQINKEDIAFELRYPIPVGDNFVNKGLDKGYTGIIDYGIDYNVVKMKNFRVGIIVNTSYLKQTTSEVDLRIISPKIKCEYNYELSKISIIPQVALGYSKLHFHAKATTIQIDDQIFDIPEEESTESGLALKAGTKVVYNSHKTIQWYCSLAYEFTKLEKPSDGQGDTAFNRNIGLLYSGVGVIWTFNK